MSAFPPKADIKKRCWGVRFVPKADIPTTSNCVNYHGSAFIAGAHYLMPITLYFAFI